MKAIPVLGIPHYNRPDLLARCIASIDYPVDRLVIVQNGARADFIGKTSYSVESEIKHVINPSGHIHDVIHIRHPNAGVAGSWNEVIKLFPAPFWMLVNNDIQFAPGDLSFMAERAQYHSEPHEFSNAPTDPPSGIVYGNHGASWFVVTAYGIKQVGLFDENLYPAYLEDCDWSYRADRLDVRRITVAGLKSIHGTATDGADQTKGSCTIHSDERLAKANQRTHGRNFEYYREKWDGINGEEKFKTPFNDPHWPLWAWKFEPGMRERQQEDWDPVKELRSHGAGSP
jgi:GT2 family glycosyltransferase